MFCALSQNNQHLKKKKRRRRRKRKKGKMKCKSYSKLSTELKNGIEISVSQAAFKLWIKTVKMLFGSITQEPLGLPKF